MSSDRDKHADEQTPERDNALPALRTWWSDLSPAAKILIPTSAAVLVFVTANAIPPFVL